MKSYILHLRPRSWVIVSLHFCAGALVASGRDLFTVANILKLICGSAIWSICLNGGTLAFNSAFDRDIGDIGYLDNPPPAPKYLAYFGLFFMALGLVLTGMFLAQWFFISYLTCLILSFIYSIPPIRLKSKAGFDVVINGIGYGALTYFGGWVLMVDKPTVISLLLSFGFGLLFASFYPLTQIYQYDDDRKNKDQTLTVFLGKRNALYFSLIFNILSFIIFLTAIIIQQINFMKYTLLLLPFFLWMVILCPWIQKMDSYNEKKGMYRALNVWGITDICVILIFSDLIWKSF